MRNYNTLCTAGTSSTPVLIDGCCYVTALPFLQPVYTDFLAGTHVEIIKVSWGQFYNMCVKKKQKKQSTLSATYKVQCKIRRWQNYRPLSRYSRLSFLFWPTLLPVLLFPLPWYKQRSVNSGVFSLEIIRSEHFQTKEKEQREMEAKWKDASVCLLSGGEGA